MLMFEVVLDFLEKLVFRFFVCDNVTKMWLYLFRITILPFNR